MLRVYSGREGNLRRSKGEKEIRPSLGNLGNVPLPFPPSENGRPLSTQQLKGCRTTTTNHPPRNNSNGGIIIIILVSDLQANDNDKKRRGEV